MKSLSVVFTIVCLLVSSATVASVKETFKVKKTVDVSKVHAEKLHRYHPPHGGSYGCEYTCSYECLERARNLLRNCSSNGGGHQYGCLAIVEGILAQRTQTSPENDQRMARRYCRQGVHQSCLVEVYGFTTRRGATTVDQDANQAYRFCIRGGNSYCVAENYERNSHRTHTNVDRDVNDALRACRVR